MNKNGESRNSNSVNPSRGTTARSTTTTKKNSTMSSSSGLSSETTGMTGSSDWSTRSGHDGMTDRRDRQPPTNGTGQILFRQNTMMARADVANTVNIQESNCLHRLLHKTLCSASITCWMAPSGASDDACVCTAAPGTLLSPQNVVLTTLTSTDNVVDTYILPVAIAGLLYVAFYSMRCDYMIGEAPFVLEWAEKYSNEIRDTKSKITKRPSDFVSDNMENIKLLWTQWKAIITEFVNITKKIPIR